MDIWLAFRMSAWNCLYSFQSCGSWKKNQLWIRSSAWCTFLTAACEITFKAGGFLWQQRTISFGGSRDVPADLHVVALRTQELRINSSFRVTAHWYQMHVVLWLFDSPSIYLCFCPQNNIVNWNNKHAFITSQASQKSPVLVQNLCVLIQVCLWLSVRHDGLTCFYVMIFWGLSLYIKMAPKQVNPAMFAHI